MPVLRKRAQGDNKFVNGLFIHSNPPRLLQLNSAYIRQLIRQGDVEKLEHAVLEGQGKKLIGEYSPDYKTRTFLKSIPALMSKISLLHDAVNSGRLNELKTLLNEEQEKKKKLVMAKDESGVGLLHKAVYYDLKDIYKWLIEKYPATVSMRDSEGRTPYHYTPMCKDPLGVQKLLTNAGADVTATDNYQHTAKYYMDHNQELELPSGQKSTTIPRKNTTNKDSLNFKKSNIRIWIHQRNMANLQQVVWEGHGGMLLVEHSNNQKIKKFLEAVPHIMGLIKDIHCDVQNDDLEKLKERVCPPIPPIVLTGKDVNGLTPLHKAAGLDKQKIAEYIIQEYPESINCVDNEGRTPLHYAALLKDNGNMTNFLIEHGADESALDHKQKTAAYYKTRHSEIDSKLLNVIPDCPRSAKESFAANFDWNILTSSPSMNWIQNGSKKALENVEQKINDEDIDDTVENRENHSGNEQSPEPVQNGDHNLKESKEDIKESHNELKDKTEASEEKSEEIKEDSKLQESPNHEKTLDLKPEVHSEPENNVEKKEISSFDTAQETHEGNISEQDFIENKDDVITEETTDNNNNDTEVTESVHPTEEKNDIEFVKEPESIPANNKTRPNSSNEAVKSRPNSQKSRPMSNAQEKSRPNSKISGKIVPPVEGGEGIIEGIVDGKNEVEAMDNEVEAGNMEQLAAMVLNGDGAKLIDMSSENPELQTFLENVPTYMSKIHKIHEAARNGSLRNLQAALDRRKFAIAKDNISPKGASPLHVAVVFGNTSIVRYLAGRFPETLQMVDDDGRTPLHYAAILNDNGHYYNLLVHLGADMRAEDKFGFNPEYYRKNQQDFNHKSLLRDFGAEEDEADEILTDKVANDTHSARKNLDDEDMIAVLERCYHLLQSRRGSTTSAISSNSVNSATKAGLLLSKHLKKHIFDSVKLRITKLDNNLYDIIWPSVKKLPTDLNFRTAIGQDFPMEITIPDFDCYYVFKEFLDPIIKDYNHLNINKDFPDQPRINFNDTKENSNIDINRDLDPQGKNILSGTLETTRNLEDFDLPKSLGTSQLEVVERIITTVLMSKEVAKALYPLTPENEIDIKGSGTYYTMNEILEEPSEVKILLASNGLLIPLWNLPDSDRLHGKYWPYGRGVFISNSANLAVWINVLDHIRIITRTDSSHPGNVGQVYSRISRLAVVLEDKLDFIFDDKLGYLSARPSAIGNTLHFNVTLRFPQLIKEPDNLKHLCVVRGLTYHRNTSTGDVIRAGNQQCLGITELQSFEDFTMAVANIIQLEKGLAMSNSLHIATMFLNIFKKKKLSQKKVAAENGHVDMPFFATEEGRYLASSLGDPLIKGLTEVANKRPEDPIAYLAQYLYNFANNRNNIKSRGKVQEEVQQNINGVPNDEGNNNVVPTTIDVVTVEPDEDSKDEESAFNPTSRDEHGQSMLHFAAARSHGRNAFFQLLQETEINVAYRDELYRTARDISIQANIPDNTEEIDRYVLYIATKGDTDKLVELLLDGYDHITDIVDSDDVPIVEAVSKANQPDTVSFLQSILAFEEKRERVHHAIRQGSINDVTALLADENDTGSGKLLAIGKNSYGRCTLHIAVLCQQEEIVDYLANTFRETLKLGDNLERTALHYAMGVEKMETISRVLIEAGAARVVKDLKGRQPTYYFLNKSDILRLQEEEETF
ncbi:uncharacterized protein LOC130442646 [Diorhabda sublineata]|uniref:uncharacterized protein LOC130442646 n=1 Tax=Diorhabda sublineata TaxID=1163346 RepID=UPI0024E151E5|nr:uncharacterized protein LOC130442646 [Diorhabda sublineata]